MTAHDPRGAQTAAHWESVWASGDAHAGAPSWHEEHPTTSVELVLTDGVPGTVVDVGAGASRLPEALLDAGVGHVTLLDLSLSALALTSLRLEERAGSVTTVVGDVLTHDFEGQHDVWHDRAVFHFLVEAEQRAAYAERARSAVRSGGLLVVGTFAADGPVQCSGLPIARYDADALVAALGEGFEPVTSRRAEHRTPLDDVQPFTWVVLRRA